LHIDSGEAIITACSRTRRFRDMIVSNPSVLFPAAEGPPAIDISEARWAVEYLTLIINTLGVDSPVSMILTQTRRELASLVQSADAAARPAPLRIAA
jgi:hypothetical protein